MDVVAKVDVAKVDIAKVDVAKVAKEERYPKEGYQLHKGVGCIQPPHQQSGDGPAGTTPLTVGLCLGSYGGPIGESVSYERGTPVHPLSFHFLARYLTPSLAGNRQVRPPPGVCE